MSQTTVHNPDRFMVDLRQILSQGKKRVGLLLGAGGPVATKIDNQGTPVIPDVSGLTTFVLQNLAKDDKTVLDKLTVDLPKNPNIETILTKIRKLSQAIGDSRVHGLNGTEYEQLGNRICEFIGNKVSAELPHGITPYSELVSWIGGINRNHPVEIFSPNYDLLLEEAFERALLPYFDGFSGAHRPFFDSTSISNDKLPARWSRIWKIHGSLGWELSGDTVIRTGKRTSTNLIYPDHLKYDQITRQPFSSLFERLKDFLKTPDSLLICVGFSFFDAHITAVLDEALEANKHTSLMAFQYKKLANEEHAIRLAIKRPNMSLYASDGAVIHGIEGKWHPGQLPSHEWSNIRNSYWGLRETSDAEPSFLLGDFAKLAHFFALSQANDFTSQPLKDEQSNNENENENENENS